MRAQQIGLVSLVLMCSACGATSAPPGAVRIDSAGIEIVRSSGTDHPLRWRFEPALSIASEDEAGAGVFDPNDALIRADREGRLYVLDLAGKRVIVFGPDGRFMQALGRKGSGPGEISFPIAFTVADDGTTGVFDIAKHRLVRFAADGTVLEEEELGPGFFGGQIHSTANDLIHDYRGGGVSGLYRTARSGGGVLVQSADPPMKPLDAMERCGMSIRGLPPLLSPSYRWNAHGERIVVARDAAYDLIVYENGREVRRIRRDIEPRPATAGLAEQELGEGMRMRVEGGVRVCPADFVVKQLGFAPVIPATGRMAVAPNGELWVKRGGVTGEKLPVDVFATDGAYLGTLPPETPFPAAFVSAERIVAVTKDEMDVGKIVIYDVKR